MSQPVIIDDGGSIRIRQIKNVAMDGLIGTPAGTFTDHASDSFGTAATFNCTLAVRYFELNGAHQMLPVGGLPLNQNDIVTITSATGQITTVNFQLSAGSFMLVITLSQSADGRQSSGRRTYVITDAGAIASVTYTRGGVVNPIYPDPAGAKVSIFTMVHFNP